MPNPSRPIERYIEEAHAARAAVMAAAFGAIGRGSMWLVSQAWRAVAASIARAAKLFRRRRLASGTYRRLAGLDDRTLRDIGLHRSGLHAAADAAAANDNVRWPRRAVR